VVINNASFGVSRESANDDNTSVKYPTSSITLRVSTENKSPIYVGGTIGYADNVGIASNNVGGIAYHEGYSAVNFEVNVTNLTNNLHLGGIAGYASDGLISNSEAVTNINVIGTLSNGEQTLNVGGLVGELKLPTSTIGVSSCQTKSVITSGDILQTSVSDQVNISAGIAVLGAGSRVSQCLFTGSVNTEGANIGQLYAGGAFAQSTSKDDDVVVGAGCCEDDAVLLTITENGYGKKTDLSEFKIQNRGGKGLFGYKITEKTGSVAGISIVKEDSDIMIITSDGIIIRTATEEISKFGRTTQGVRVMRLAEGVKVVSTALTEKEEEQEIEQEEPVENSVETVENQE